MKYFILVLFTNLATSAPDHINNTSVMFADLGTCQEYLAANNHRLRMSVGGYFDDRIGSGRWKLDHITCVESDLLFKMNAMRAQAQAAADPAADPAAEE
ncbi:MAG: hypothetical protein H6907_13110 [Hyphomicrobiales bacterium]|nr:hypothetical protein [Hyphomicrobiales bacterium]MCP5372664.1 hypothetical protein [Hyphomicrobiales bacterium]